MADLSRAVKAALLARLDASAGVTALVPAGRIYPMQPRDKPVYPFIRYGVPTIQPYEDGCGVGVEMTVPIHAFADSEDGAQLIAAAIAAALDNAPGFTACDWVRTQFMPDGDEADIWHAIVEFSVTRTV